MNQNVKKKGHGVGKIIAAVVVVLVLFFSLITFITNWEWFSEMGYTSVFFTEIITKVVLGAIFAVITFVIAMLYITRLRKKYFEKIASSETPNMKRLKVIGWILAVLTTIIVVVSSVPKLWYELLQFMNATGFGIVDPIFGIDVSFYIFKLDFLDIIDELMIFYVFVFVALTVVYYIVLAAMRTPDIYKEKIPDSEEQSTQGKNAFSGTPLEGLFSKLGVRMGGMNGGYKPQPKKELDRTNIKQILSVASGKLSALGCIFFILVAIDYALKQFQLLYAHNGTVYGAGFTDVNITLWKFRIICVLSVIFAVLFVVFMMKKKYVKVVALPVILIAVGLLGSGIGIVVQNFIVSPDELDKESPYIADNIEYTQYAYGLDNVITKQFTADNKLTAADIAANPETIDNIRINDFDPAQQFYNQTQAIRQYYTFFDVDNDRYMVNGEYTQTFVTAREIDENKISDTWLNRHIKYTHGYGVALSRVDKVTSSGQPDVLIGNIPPESSVNEIKITRPEIYFGELTDDYIIVGTDEPEFDYPNGDANSYTAYEGNAGIKLNFINRILFAVREGNIKILVSSNINDDSKIIINRDVANRVQKIMPYLEYEGDPYMVIADGKLYWIMDAYTRSSNYPYSEPYSMKGDNYIRNSVKVVVDAYNGDVVFYVVDNGDPIALTMQKIYPSLFKSLSSMPESLQEHLRYPNLLFEIQAGVYGKYHMEDIAVFYQSEDLWDIAYEIYATEKIRQEGNYYIAKLPGESKAEFFNSITFTPKSKQNMTGLLIARNDGDHYGELMLYQFPKSRTIYGTEQIEAQIDQNTEISKEFTLWTSAGTSYRRGNLFVIPINNSILYVEPVYLEAQNSSIPEVKRIIVAYNDQIAYGETLKECLEELFGDLTPEDPTQPEDPTVDPTNPGTEITDPTTPEVMDQDALISAAAKAYNDAIKAQRNGDWASYGKYMNELEKYLNELAK